MAEEEAQEYLVVFERKTLVRDKKGDKQWGIVTAASVQEAIEKSYVPVNTPVYVINMRYVALLMKKQMTEIVPYVPAFE